MKLRNLIFLILIIVADLYEVELLFSFYFCLFSFSYEIIKPDKSIKKKNKSLFKLYTIVLKITYPI